MSADYRGIGMTSQRSRDRLIRCLREMGIQSAEVLEAIRDIPRHIFVDEALASRAYENNALPIGHGQTISQPYIVARMTEALLDGGAMEKVLEIGTGCGYQAVVLARLVGKVYSVERIEALARKAREKARMLKFRNIRIDHSDGNQGWPEYAPYDGIVVTAAPLGVPEVLLDQLGPSGRLVIPVGLPGEQELFLISRTEEGFHEERLDWVSFVPMLEGVG
ncbi:MAG: protein-L-isoaspartate(D-aspartate) O-methyltransferase [Gammaproteobacteria bacterium]|nr:protein-L-isoaspartate(D-aspartate) O-methyltransferase [Gammaproteobacteria bacterium]